MNLGNKTKYALLSILFVASSFAMRREERIDNSIAGRIIRKENIFPGHAEIQFIQTIGNITIRASELITDDGAPRYAGMRIEGGARHPIRGEAARKTFEELSLQYQQQNQQ